MALLQRLFTIDVCILFVCASQREAKAGGGKATGTRAPFRRSGGQNGIREQKKNNKRMNGPLNGVSLLWRTK